jgi:hypothetical protein
MVADLQTFGIYINYFWQSFLTMISANPLLPYNFIVCTIGGIICMCRLGRMSNRTKTVILMQYVFWLMAFSLSNLASLVQTVNIAQLGFSMAAMMHQVSGFRAWKYGVPAYAVKAWRYENSHKATK